LLCYWAVRELGWLDLEIVARYGKIGLWVEPDPIPPWEFRQGKAKN